MRRYVTLLTLILLCTLIPSVLHATSAASGLAAPDARAMKAYGNLPLSFIENQGQTDDQVGYVITGPQASAFFRDDGVTFDLFGKHTDKASCKHSVLKVTFAGADPDCVVEGADRLPGRVNYLIGKDQSKWLTGVPAFKGVVYKDVWPGIDVAYHGDRRQLKYDIAVAPGLDLANIRMKYEGAEKIWVDEAGDLNIKTAVTTFIERVPGIYQEKEGQKTALTGGYTLEDGNTVGFHVEGRDPSSSLMIDPAADLVYSTFLGGSSTDSANAIAVDSSGSAYVAGQTYSWDFPTTPGAEQTTLHALNGSSNAFVTKLSSDGSALSYSTFLGGRSDDRANGIAVDSSGCAYITGMTTSSDFPPTPNALNTTLNCPYGDAFVAKLSSDGSTLVYSFYLGGSGNSTTKTGDQGNGIAVKSSNGVDYIYVTGTTRSADFPITPNAYQNALNSTYGNAFVTELWAIYSSQMQQYVATEQYSTYLGGSGGATSGDQGNGIAVDASGNVYVTGSTTSSAATQSAPTGFPVTSGAFSTSLAGTQNAFVAKFDVADSQASSLVYSTYLGGNGSDTGAGIAVDSSGDAYVAGSTTSTNFPATAGSLQTSLPGKQNVFMTELNPAGSWPIYSTYLGGAGTDTATGIAVDSNHCAYVSGMTDSSNFPTTLGAYQTALQGTQNAFVSKLNNIAGLPLVYSTYLGGKGADAGNGVAVDSAGCAYIAGSTTSANFPTTTGAYQAALNGTGNAFVSKVSMPIVVNPSAGPNGTITPNTPREVSYNGSITFTAKPFPQYTVYTWYLDGNPVQTGGTTFGIVNVTASHTVHVTFILNRTYTVTPSAGANGTISPNTPVTNIAYGGYASFTAMPSYGYTVATWSVDGNIAQTGGTSFTLSAITNNHTVLVTFEPPAWPMFGHDMGHTSLSQFVGPETTPIDKWASPFLTPRWITSNPAIGADGTIYVGEYGGDLYAINPDGHQEVGLYHRCVPSTRHRQSVPTAQSTLDRAIPTFTRSAHPVR